MQGHGVIGLSNGIKLSLYLRRIISSNLLLYAELFLSLQKRRVFIQGSITNLDNELTERLEYPLNI